MNNPASSGKIGAGKGILNRHERNYKKGSLMFIEGESSTEMFIVRSGKIRILKQEGECTVELAVLGPGSVLGELALLDHQPRTATAQVIEETTVTVIDEEIFAHTMQRIPPWLSNLIQLIVKRLRDTMKKVSDDIVEKSIAGVIRVILLLAEKEPFRNKGFSSKLSLSYVKDTIYSITGLGGLEAENVFLHLILKDMVLINKSDTGKEFLELKNPDALELYMNYLRAKQRGITVPGENFSDAAFELLEVIVSAGEQNGKREGKLIRLGVQQIEIELKRKGLERNINIDALDTLKDAKLIVLEDEKTSAHMTHQRSVVIYSPENGLRVLNLKKWLPVFKEEIRF